MSYVDKTLIQGEAVQARARLHWLIYVWPLLLLVIGLAVVYWSRGLTTPAVSFIMFGIGALIAVFGFAKWLHAFIRAWTTELAVTNFRVISKSGLIERQTVEQILNRVDSIEVTQGLLGRILDYGTVMITGTGVVHSPLSMIADPLGFRRAVHTAIEKHPQASGPIPPQPKGP